MKENAPEKIYFDGKSNACKLPIFSSRNIEYVRADTFIEKACNAFCKVCKMPNCKRNECKVISNFKECLEII